MTATDVKDCENSVILKNQFEIYKAWRSLPSILRYPPSKYTATEYAQSLGIENEEILELLEIRTKGDFATKYHVHPNTLTNWEKVLRNSPTLQDTKHWATNLTKNMILSMYRHAMKSGNPAMYKLWFQVIEDFKEATRHEIDTPNLTQFSVSVRSKEMAV